MKELIKKKNDCGLFVADKDKSVRVDSRYVAEVFGKRHGDVLRAIRNLTAENSGLSKEFNERNFALSKYKDAKGEFRTSYALTH